MSSLWVTCSEHYQAVEGMRCGKSITWLQGSVYMRKSGFALPLFIAVASPLLLQWNSPASTSSLDEDVEGEVWWKETKPYLGEKGSLIVLHGWIIQLICDNWATVRSASVPSTEDVARQYWIQRWQVVVCDVICLCVSGYCGCSTALTPAGHSVE